MDFLKALIVVSEKAANIARLLQQNENIFKKLVEVKSDAEANPRFKEDFNTLADVLIQEMVKHDISLQFPSLKDKIRGEESNHFFSQTLDKEVIVEVKSTKEETALMLLEILDDDNETADLVAAEVHKVMTVEDVCTKIPDEEFEINTNELSIWIDPIDATNEYVNGLYEKKDGDLYLKGLQCVTVLIGVYDTNGQPVIGVINQPFLDIETKNSYRCHWGVCFQNNNTEIKLASIREVELPENGRICIGSTEDKRVIEILESAGYSLVVTRGAGYKFLAVYLGLADAYVLSKPTTYFWDTCAGQAILRAVGGDIVEMRGIISKRKNFVKYGIRSDNTKNNKDGIIAYRNEKILNKLMELQFQEEIFL